mmetsp:Transcript_81357/g.226570  ORF Transcript_81357/g.226570 Transcript_81357/m.226570 type:complete len:203 (+) Transcript_81357:410-1018(+)
MAAASSESATFSRNSASQYEVSPSTSSSFSQRTCDVANAMSVQSRYSSPLNFNIVLKCEFLKKTASCRSLSASWRARRPSYDNCEAVRSMNSLMTRPSSMIFRVSASLSELGGIASSARGTSSFAGSPSGAAASPPPSGASPGAVASACVFGVGPVAPTGLPAAKRCCASSNAIKRSTIWLYVRCANVLWAFVSCSLTIQPW